MTEPLLIVENLTVDFPTEDGMVHSVRGASYEVRPGEVLGIVGESGCGKSVSSQAIMGLLPPNAQIGGSITFRGRELVGLSERDWMALRGNDIAMIFQDPMSSLNPVYTVGRQLAEAYQAHHDVARSEAAEKAVEALRLVGIPQPDRRADQYPHEFSGGMRQRAMIAMAIINDPDLIIADEPTTALDVTVQAQILETLLKIRDETGAAIMMITHDLGVVAGGAARVQVMYGGTIVESGPVEEVFAQPRMPYTIGLLGSVPNPEMLGKPLTPIHGSPPSLLHPPPGCSFGPRCPLVEPECREAEPELVAAPTDRHLARCRLWPQVSELEQPQRLFWRPEMNHDDTEIEHVPVASAEGSST
jgi:peptide/nickel transport system ATP-binding protein